MLPLRAAILLALGLATLTAVVSVAADGVPKEFVVNVSPAGFDPSVCKISRGDHVSWKNTGATPIRVIWPDPNSSTPLFDTGELKPGQTSLPYAGFVQGGSHRFVDAANSAHVNVIITPTWSNDWDAACTPTGLVPADPAGPSAFPRRAFIPALATDRPK